MFRVVILPWMVLIPFIFALALSTTATAQEFVVTDEFTPEQFREYERKLNAILKTRRDEEKLFVAQVVQRVQTKELPSKLVQTSYLWARNKRPGTKYPFIYFERILRLQAEKIGLDDKIPDFDHEIYNQTETALPREARSDAQATTPPVEDTRKTVLQRLFSVFR